MITWKNTRDLGHLNYETPIPKVTPSSQCDINTPAETTEPDVGNEKETSPDNELTNDEQPLLKNENETNLNNENLIDENTKEYVNGQDVLFTIIIPVPYTKVPYNSGCVLELIKFLVAACDPQDQQNTEVMIGVGLNLLVNAFEVGAYAIKSHTNMHPIIKDQLYRNTETTLLRLNSSLL